MAAEFEMKEDAYLLNYGYQEWFQLLMLLSTARCDCI